MALCPLLLEPDAATAIEHWWPMAREHSPAWVPAASSPHVSPHETAPYDLRMSRGVQRLHGVSLLVECVPGLRGQGLSWDLGFNPHPVR